jgi:hypothetical protein
MQTPLMRRKAFAEEGAAELKQGLLFSGSLVVGHVEVNLKHHTDRD